MGVFLRLHIHQKDVVFLFRFSTLGKKDTGLSRMRKALIKKLDQAWSKKVKELANYKCESCGASGEVKRLNSHHFHGRRCRSVRWDLENGFCLCVGCHKLSNKFSAHETPAEFVEWAIEKRGQEWYDELKYRKNSIMKYKDYDFETLLDGILA